MKLTGPEEATMPTVIQAESPEEIARVRELFREYGAIPDFCECFTGFQEETQGLPGMYAPPEGRLLLAYMNGEAAGCIGLRKMEPGYCEIRRLYVRSRFRGRRLGRTLAEEIIIQARQAGYHTARLGTLPVMKEAIALYQSLGFSQAAPYKANALDGALYMELRLD
ncbi:MAG: GNAT family N-acetyltransferase [Acidobacteria bacterium]|nr:GNAT family N-acetyltransferase [Acidobacteriota bacterium]